MKLVLWYWRERRFKAMMAAFLLGGPIWDLLPVIWHQNVEPLATALTYGLTILIHLGLLVASTSKRIRARHYGL